MGLRRSVSLMAPYYTRWVKETLGDITKAATNKGQMGRVKKLAKELKLRVHEMQQALDEYAASAGPGSVLVGGAVWREIRETVKDAPWQVVESLTGRF